MSRESNPHRREHHEGASHCSQRLPIGRPSPPILQDRHRGLCGAPGRTRTGNPALRTRPLIRLSFRSKLVSPTGFEPATGAFGGLCTSSRAAATSVVRAIGLEPITPSPSSRCLCPLSYARKLGVSDEIRTRNITDHNRALCRLSYAYHRDWSERRDSNPRSQVSQTCALPG